MKNQKTTDQFWIDETGNKIQFSRTTKSERLQEHQAFKICKEAQRLNADLTQFKERIKTICQKVYDTFMEDKNVTKTGKGNFTWYNFDRSIKIAVNINERIEFDELGIAACKNQLDEFLSGSVESKDEAIKALVMDAFNNTKGRLDAKKVMNLLRYKSKISHKLFQDAMTSLENSIRRPDSKTYFQVWVKNEEGEYQAIDLNFSSI